MPQVKLNQRLQSLQQVPIQSYSSSSKRNCCGFRIIIPHPFAHKEADEEHHDKVNRQWNAIRKTSSGKLTTSPPLG
jgi:hypothetical protein